MKITVCDPCKVFDNKVVETQRYMKVKGQRQLRLDVCPEHAKEVQKMTMPQYKEYCHKVMLKEMGIENIDPVIDNRFL